MTHTPSQKAVFTTVEFDLWWEPAGPESPHLKHPVVDYRLVQVEDDGRPFPQAPRAASFAPT